ncbi:uncharacterized protein ZBIST_3338 [Zygosaccharomyces bailii]|nr:uncharacterized protein ZBIST_3338 [Zygosaccharomyces bailii]
MEKTNGGGDYFENDNNGLWSWYITNIRNGDFEELTGNQLKRSLLKRFLHIYLDPEFSSRPDTKVMIVSIPENIHRDLALLESFLHEHFHLDDMQITKLTTSHVYNHENHYIVTDKVNNFKDPGFLQFASKNIQLAGTAGALGDDMMKYREQNGNGIPSPPPSSVQMVKNNTEDSSEDAEGDDDSIVIDFVHHGHHPVPNPTIQQTETVSTNDDAASIDSCDSVVAAGTDASYEGPPLSLTTTRTGESCFSSEEDDSELASVDSTSQTCDDDWSSSQIDTFMSILPSISIEDSFGHFRLVLQSVLFQNPVNKEIFTAIRQSNNEPTIADVNDDWLLYDSDFSMDNLQMLTLQDLTETNTHCPKILFYSLVEVPERVIRDSETEHACSLETHTESVTRAPSVVSVSCEPELFYPVPPGAHGNNKLTKGCTNDSNGGQKSVNSDWHRRSLAFSDVHSHAPRVLTAADPSNGQTDSTTLGVVERSRSTPLPAILKTISGVDQRNKSWKGKLRRRTSRKGHRPSGDKSCIIS